LCVTKLQYSVKLQMLMVCHLVTANVQGLAMGWYSMNVSPETSAD